jgi:hypothetical protein
VTGDESLLWKWTELPRFGRLGREICEKTGVPYEDAFDDVRWSIEVDVCRGPFSVSHPDPRFRDEQWRYFRVIAAPGRTGLPDLVVTFRVARYPEFGKPGVIEGREIWIEQELREIGISLDETDEPRG